MSEKRTGKISFSQHEFQCLMKEYSKMAEETKNKRLAAKCAKLCLSQVITSVTIGDDDKRLCYRSDNEYLRIAERCLKV